MATKNLEHGIKHYEHCICEKLKLPIRFTCPIFEYSRKDIDIDWCSSLTPEERAKYSNSFSKKNTLINRFPSYDINDNWLQLYLSLHNTKYLFCEQAELDIERNFLSNVNNLESLKLENIDMNNVQVLCLGHYAEQINSIKNQPYLKKINLNHITHSKYSGNEWAESRAFLYRELFENNKEYIGYSTASWAMKFTGAKIDNLHNWKYIPYLLNSKEQNGIVFCADVHCLCLWKYSLFSLFGDATLLDLVLKEFGYKLIHKKILFCNQFIAHKSIVYKYLEYLEKENIMSRVKAFVYNNINSKPNKKKYIESLPRSEAWIMELITCLWFSNQNYTFIPNAERKNDWYLETNVKSREKKFLKETENAPYSV